MLLATSAGAHVGGTVSHLWNQHIKPRADVRYANAVAGTDKARNADKIDGIDSSGLLKDTLTVSANDTVSKGNFDTQIVLCPAGYEAVGGGVDLNQVFTGRVTASGPTVGGQRPVLQAVGQHGAADGWWGAVELESTAVEASVSWTIEVICARS
jgi:hypothetical protein